MTQEPQKEDLFTMKWLTTAGIFMEVVTIGCANNFYAPILVDLKNRYNTDIESVSIIVVASVFGFMIGAITGGQLFNRVIKRQYGVLLTLMGTAASLFLTPYCPSLPLLYLNSGLLGFCHGAYETAQMVWLLEMWQNKTGPFFQAKHFLFAVGKNLPILMVTPFLSNSNINNDTTETAKYTGEDTELIERLPQSSDLRIPFIMAGSLAVFNVIYELFLIKYYKYKKPPLENEGNPVNSENDAESQMKSSKWYRYNLILISGLFLGCYGAMSVGTTQFLSTFAQFGHLKLSEVDGAIVLMGLNGAFAIGSVIGIWISLKVPSHVILVFNLIFVASGNATLFFWANYSYEMLWVGCIAIGLGLSTMFASFYMFVAKNLEFTDQIVSFMLVSSTCLAIVPSLIVGKYIEKHPLVLVYSNVLCVSICIMAFMAACLLITRHNIIKHKN